MTTRSRRLYVVNESTLVTDEEARLMARACNAQARDHASPVWGNKIVVEFRSGSFIDAQASVRGDDWVISILDDDSESEGALGWHWQDDTDHIYGKIFAKPCLEDGKSSALSGPYAVSSVLSHEVLETLADPFCNLYSDSFQGFMVAVEICDPVEADTYTIGVQRHPGQLGNVPVVVSNFVYPEWFDATASTGEKYDYLGKCKAPLTMTPGAYWVQMPSGAEQQKWGEVVGWEKDVGFDVRDTGKVIFSSEMPEWKRELKMKNGRNKLKRRQTD